MSENIVYLIRDAPDDYNNNIFNKADLTKRTCIWNCHWEPNMWLLTKRLLEDESKYVLKTPTVKDLQLFNELRNAKWVIDTTANLTFSRNLDEEQDRWLLDKIAIVIFEPSVVFPGLWSSSFHNTVNRVFMCDDSYAKTNPNKYFLVRYPFYSGFKSIIDVNFEQKKLCCAMNAYKLFLHSNSLYQKRIDDFLFWDRNYSEDFDIYGHGWPENFFQNYKGAPPPEAKIETLSKYRFCLCYENVYKVDGFVTEKIFNCFEAGCVPVYIGPNNIDQFIPKECYIDRTKFKDNKELYCLLKNMTEQDYSKYLYNIKKYLNSDLPEEFSYEQFAKYIVRGLLAE